MRLLILHSRTGGGHLAAARAIQAALADLAPEVEVRLVDGLAEGTRWPFRDSPRIYERMMRHARWLWVAIYHLTNGPLRARWMVDLLGAPSRGRMRALLQREAPDLIVSTHPLLTRLVRQVSQDAAPERKMAVVVTDLVTGNFTWYDRGADRIFAPSEEVIAKLIRHGFPEDRLVLTGQAVHPKCGTAVAHRPALRHKFGWQDPVIVLVGGGDGMGALEEHAFALDAGLKTKAHLVIVCGRNEPLRARLAGHGFRLPVTVHGFVDNLHELLAAADLVVTKGGPGTIAEACVAGLPILIYDYLPGQEIGNVRFVISRGLGALAEDPKTLVQEAEALLQDPARRAAIRPKAQAAAHADSAHRIARGLLDLLPETRPDAGVP